MSRHNKFPLKILLISVVLLLVAIYIALRIFLPKYQKYVLGLQSVDYVDSLLNDQPEIVTHPYVGFVELPKPNKDIVWQINKYGFYGPEPIAKRSNDKVIIGIAGGSVSVHYFRDERESLAEKLKNYPAFKNKKIEVYSIGLDAHKQPQQLMTLNYFLALGGQFDIVVNIDGFNETTIAYNSTMWGGYSTYFPFNWPIWTRRMLGVKQYQLVNAIQIHKKNLEAIKSFFSRPFFKDHFKLIQDFLYLHEQSQYIKLLGEFNQSLSEKDRNYQASGPETGSKEEREKDIIDVWKQSSIQMSTLAKGNNILYLHFLQPNQYLPNSKTLTKNELVCCYNLNHPYRQGVLNLYPRLIAEGKSLKDSGVIFTDLTMVFKNVNEDVYADDCCHLNSFGSSILNDQIVQKIIENYK